MASPDRADRPRLIDPLDGYLGYQLRRASAIFMADLANSLAPFALRPTEASALMVIGANPDSTQSDVGRLLGIQRANMAPLIAGLAGRHLIERDAIDGRSQALRLSAAGHETTTAIRAAIEAHEARFLTQLTPGQRQTLIDRLRGVRESDTPAT